MDSLLVGPLIGPVGCNACISCGKQSNAYFLAVRITRILWILVAGQMKAKFTDLDKNACASKLAAQAWASEVPTLE